MAVWVVTGKLGGGKSIMSVSKIREYLNRGATVATNLDLNLKFLVGRKAKMCRVLRVPDKPDVYDLQSIGVGNPTFQRGKRDESKNGLLVLDECGTWFNSRSWNDKGRQELINWLLHARKLGWDIIFIVQHLSVIDKQARLTLAEHVVYCKRTDRLSIPVISPLLKMLTFGFFKLPKIHVGIVKYGDEQNALTVDKWSCMGGSLYYCYDTLQVFSHNYEHGVFSYLPPYYTHHRYAVNMSFNNIMRMTKIYWKKWSRPVLFVLGISLSYSYFEARTLPALISASEPVDLNFYYINDDTCFYVNSLNVQKQTDMINCVNLSN
ncbi:zonular occludens toxin domain-containing protein [Photobacterium phosphoreum]|uniref:zonular occludens toxin domain-containing protein n=1 Tax=Photobacterium phosphoreum TaxID=659 RepID=UPI000D174268|nr:zonular occludens toxin domain-containing protein [Photobacterium phosphoreum]PSU56796.1 assembly protein [Photobacterium phosphoreum]